MPRLSELTAPPELAQAFAPAPRRVRLSELQAPTIATVTAPPDPTDGMGIGELFAAGLGQGISSANDSIEQLMANAPGIGMALNPTIGMQAAANPGLAEQINRGADESARLDAPLLDTGAGMTGSFTGNAIATAPFGVAGKAAEGAGWLAKTLAAMRGGALGGGVAGAVQPVTGASDGGFAGEKVAQVGTGAGAGAAAGGVLNRLGAMVENLLPSNATANVLNTFNRGANASPMAKEGERLAQATGVELTPAQVSGSRAMAMAENASRQSIFSREIAEAGDRKRVQQLADHFEQTLDKLTKQASSPAAAGARVQEATKATVTKLEEVRAKRAAADYGAVRELTKGAATIQPQNTHGLLTSILEENQGIGTPGGDALANFARKQLGNTTPKVGGLTDADKQVMTQLGIQPGGEINPMAAQLMEKVSPGLSKRLAEDAAPTAAPAQGNLDKLMQLRSYLSKVAGGQAKISGENQDRRIAAQLLQAIDDDIEAAADTIGGDVGGLLKKANANFRDASKRIESVKASPLGKILGEDFAGALQTGEFNSIAPEKVMERLGKLKPTDLGIVRGILEKEQPEAWAVFKRGLLEDALEKAKAFPPSDGANTAVLRPNMLLKHAGDRQKLRAVYSADELKEIEDALDVARRLSDRTGYNFSGTAGQQEVLGLMNKVTDLSAKGAASAGGMFLGSRSIARLMNDNGGRAALLKLRHLPPGSKRARQLAAQITAIAAADEQAEPRED